MKLIDRISKALVDEFFGVGWYDRQDDEFRRRWRSMAHAAVAAMREPTGEMTSAGKRSRNAQALFTADDAYHAWRAMIDAALHKEAAE